MKIIIGLGNPGQSYSKTRHNAGFICIDAIAKKYDFTIAKRYKLADISLGHIENEDIALVKPQTFVNDTGRAVKYLTARFNITPSDLIILVDDMALPVGKLRIRTHGSSGGHNGLKSIIETLGTTEFPRIRLGIGWPESGNDEIQHVLTPFTHQEAEIIRSTAENVVKTIPFIITYGIESAMAHFN
jgi:PTH1 family peptidyl-tRNA hydrolase